MIDKSNGVPIYKQIKSIMLSEIRSEKWSKGTKLPSEDDLAKHFGVSRGTIRQTIGELVNEGILKRVHGSGTFVTEPGIEYKIDTDNFLSFLEEMERTGFEINTQILEKGIATASILPSEYIYNTNNVYYIKRIREIDGKPVMFSIDYLPCDIFKDAARRYNNNKSVYSFLENTYDVRICKAKRTFYAISAQDEVSEVLKLKDGEPLFYIIQQAFDEKNRCIDCSYLYIISEAMHFSITTKRNKLDSSY